ncbi:MAG: M24 family metallopeptidase [Burkholderiales bacterium]|nr:M24 family metallopeptidase [Burkholderiales bacterium]
MQTMHSTLLIGAYDWEPAKLPEEEYRERIAAFWEALPDRSCAGVAVYGDRRNNAQLAYLSNMIPKLRDGLALVPRRGEPKVLVSGGPNAMVPAVRQTWMPVEPLGEAAKEIDAWRQTLGGPVALAGFDSVRMATHEALAGIAGDGRLSAEAHAVLRAAMRNKRPRERAAMREACGMLRAAVAALAASQSGGPRAGVTEAMARAEGAALRLGAQEVRTLFSTDGGRTLRPFFTPIDRPVEPLQVYVAVRHLGYWAEGFVHLAASPGAVAHKAGAALQEGIALVRPGAACRDIAAAMRRALAPLHEHPVTAGSFGNAIGLDLEEAPRIAGDSTAELQPGGVYTLRAGACDGAQHAIVSAMVAPGEGGCDVLWSAV